MSEICRSPSRPGSISTNAPVGHESADRAGDCVTGLERGAAAGQLATGLLLKNDAAIDDNIFICHVRAW